ncbi:hypothetical protein [Kiloniella antarctica]|uniref:Uncharacterized protein n=1 Tax=Kiloniella antarctica TaxID=1550907 RepID=A0ABW5BNQ0_9PROT
MAEDLGTIERRKRGGMIIKDHYGANGFTVGKGAAVEYPTLIEQLFVNGYLGTGNEAKRRKEVGLWLTDLMEKVYRSEGVAGYSTASSAEYEVTDEEDRDKTLLNKTMRKINLCDWRLLKVMCHVQDKDNIAWTARNMVGEAKGYQRALDKLAEVRGIG